MKKIRQYIFVAMLLLLGFLMTPQTVSAWQPNSPSGVGTFVNTSKASYDPRYRTRGFTLNLNGSGFTTLASVDAAAVIDDYTSPSPVYGTTFSVVTSTGNKRIAQGSRKTNKATIVYYNSKVVINPTNFNPNSTVYGRSLLDNMYREGYNRASLDARVTAGNTGWLNAITAVRRYGSSSDYSSVKNGAKYSAGKSAYTVPTNTYVNTSNLLRFGFSADAKKGIAAGYDNSFTLPRILEVDRTAPSGYFTPNSASWTNGNVAPKFTPTDTGGSGVDKWRYRRYANGSWGAWSGWSWSGTSGFGTLAQGTHRFQVQVRDKAGNIGTVTSGYYYIDKTTPTATASPSTRGWGNTNVTVKLTYKDTGGSGLNVQQCKWETSTTRPTSWANYSNYPNGVSTGTAGTNYLHYRVSDKAGNIRYGYFGPYKIDKTAPTVTANPASRGWGNTDVTVKLTYKDTGGSGLSTRKYHWSKELEPPIPTSNLWKETTSTSLTHKKAEEGTWYLHYRVFDVAGNVTTKRFGPYKIDKTTPDIQASPQFFRDWDNTDVKIKLHFNDAGGSGISTRQYAWSTSTTTPTNWSSYSSDVIQTSDGAWYLHAKATDVAGNVTTKRFGPYKIDKTYTVKFDGNTNTSGSMTDQIMIYNTSMALKENAFKKTGYSFNGWATSPTGTSVYSDKQVVKNLTTVSGGTVNLYATWDASTYYIKYHKNDRDESTYATGSTAGQTFRYDTTYTLTPNGFAKEGYLFDGWNTKPDGSGTSYADKQTVKNLTATNGTSIDLYAQWKPIKHTIVFHKNSTNGDGIVTGSMANITATFDSPITLPENKYQKTTKRSPEMQGGSEVIKPSVFKGWALLPSLLEPTFLDETSVLNLSSVNNSTVTLYAIWDDAPEFDYAEYPDRYFTLLEAQAGVITEEELLSTVVVRDRETNPLPKKTSTQVAETDDFGITLYNYDAEDFTGLTSDSAVSVTYKAKDTSGNVAYLTIVVHITSDDPSVTTEINYLRNISDYYVDKPVSEGGLPSNSKWKTNDTYKDMLNKASNGVISKSYSFTKDDIDDLRSFIEDKGMGNSNESSALLEFYNMIE